MKNSRRCRRRCCCSSCRMLLQCPRLCGEPGGNLQPRLSSCDYLERRPLQHPRLNLQRGEGTLRKNKMENLPLRAASGEPQKEPRTVPSSRARDPGDEPAPLSWGSRCSAPTMKAVMFSLWQHATAQSPVQADAHPLIPIYCFSTHCSTHLCCCVSSHRIQV